ncbi:anthranilate synthase component 2 [Ereboglobus sp. PH5-10]|uniref:anthranilate synthase component II n=1 Tax=Ereboglobus sp. PH5-10 TaxID=2940629 RepID=UPI0024066EB4|nr:aminodeoxychorismate/anthranilate synthase component II [Ereboglobus sp. PH5-10]MDF9826826.1 anthranilate synthase component 2 [Ereboglobus sp. PH5-10]
MILIIDNFDSFTFNIAHCVEVLGARVVTMRNDAVTLGQIAEMRPRGIILSPGPGRPENAGILCPAIKEFAGKIPMLGVCLGHQAIASVFGAKIIRAKEIRHGKISEITHDGRGTFEKLPSPLRVVRYHSLAVDAASLPDGFEITARARDGEIMGVRNAAKKLEGLQYHPESIMSSGGKMQFANFLRTLEADR